MAGRLYDNLKNRFSKKDVFFDLTTLEPGEDFRTRIVNSIAISKVLLAVIGPNWLDSFSNAPADDEDFVVFEIALAFDSNIRVIPILLDDTRMPAAKLLPDKIKTLASKQAFNLNNLRFEDDFERLAAFVSKNLAGQRKKVPWRRIILGTAASLLAIFLMYWLWPGPAPETRGITKIFSETPQAYLDWSRYQFAFTEPKNPAGLPIRNFSLLYITRQASEQKDGFFYLVKPSTPEVLSFRQSGYRLYVNQVLKALCLGSNDSAVTVTAGEIQGLETITISNTSLSDELFNQVAGILQSNPRISIIDFSILDEANPAPKISNAAFQLMKLTTPEILVCASSLQEIATLNNSQVQSAVIIGRKNSSPGFYENLRLPRGKNFVLSNTESSKITIGDSAESVSFINDSTIANLKMIKNKRSIKQLQFYSSHSFTRLPVNFEELKEFKGLESFGYSCEDQKLPQGLLASIKNVTDLSLSNVSNDDLAIISRNNANITQLAISFEKGIKDLNWVKVFPHLKSLFLDEKKLGSFRKYENVVALTDLKDLNYLGVRPDLNRDSAEYRNLMTACPKCNIYPWGFCLGSGWLLLFFPAIGFFLLINSAQQKRKISSK